MLPAQEDHPWISIGKFLNWTTEKIWTKRGATFFCIASILIGIFWYYEDDRPWMILFSPLAILALVVFLFFASIAAGIGDLFADWVMGKLFRQPNPKNSFHQLVYFILSSFSFVLAAVVLNFGDSDVRGYWRN